MAKFQVFKGDTWRGSATLRTKDACDQSKMNNYEIPSDANVQLRFPGSQTIDSDSGDVVIASYPLGQITWTVPTDVTSLVTAGNGAAIDCVVISNSEGITTFEKLNIIDVKTRAN